MTLLRLARLERGRGLRPRAHRRRRARPRPRASASAPNARVLDDDGRDVVPGSGEAGVLAVADVDARSATTTTPSAPRPRSARSTAAATRCPATGRSPHDDGTITLLGRGSGCINTGGEKVWPEEVEEALKEHPDVVDALVVGVPDDEWGESVAAVVAAARRRHARRPTTLGEWVADRLARYKRPRRVVVVDEVQRTTIGKADYAWARRAAHRARGARATRLAHERGRCPPARRSACPAPRGRCRRTPRPAARNQPGWQVGAASSPPPSRGWRPCAGGRRRASRRRGRTPPRRTAPPPRARTPAPPCRRHGRGTRTARRRPARRAPSRRAAGGSRTTPAPSPGRATPRAAGAPSRPSGCPRSRHVAASGTRSPRTAAPCAPRPGRSWSRSTVTPPPSEWPSATTSSARRARRAPRARRARAVGERALGEVDRSFARAVAAHVDRDRPVLVAQAPRERVEHTRAESVGVLQQQGRAVAAPVERRDLETVVLHGDRPGIHRAQGTRLP